MHTIYCRNCQIGMLVCYLEHSLTYCLPAINHDDCGPNHKFQKAVKIGIRFFFLFIPLRQHPTLSASSQMFHHHLYPSQTLSDNDSVATSWNSPTLQVYLWWELSAVTRETKHQLELKNWLLRSLHWSDTRHSIATITGAQTQPFWSHTHPHKATAHVGVGDREVGLWDGLLKDEVDNSFQALFRVNGQFSHLLHERLEHLRRQFVQHAADALEQLLRFYEVGVIFVDATWHAAALHWRFPGLLCFIQLDVFRQGNARNDLPRLLPALTLTWTSRAAQTGRLMRQRKYYLFIYYFLFSMSAERLLQSENNVNNKSHAINKKDIWED